MSLISLIDGAWLGSCSMLKSRMTKELRCEDVFRGCAYVSVGSDIRALMAEYMAHVRDVQRRLRGPAPRSAVTRTDALLWRCTSPLQVPSGKQQSSS